MSLSEKEKNKIIQEKCQTILSDLLKDEDNKYCVDCDAKSPRWASWNLGIFLCIRCAGIHRNLGVHISRVKSVNLDSWTPQQVACIQQMGNSRARAVYEANIPDSFRRPQMDFALEQFVKAKYEDKKYIAKEWVQPPMPNPTWDIELEKQLRKKKREKTSAGTVELPTPINTRASRGNSASPKPLPKAPGSKGPSPSPGAKVGGSSSSSAAGHNTTAGNTSVTQDLLGLDAVTSTGSGGGGGGSSTDNSDPFGEFLAAPGSQPAPTTTPPATTTTTQPGDTTRTEEENFFNQKLPENQPIPPNKLTKDSILALYGQTPSAGPQSQPQGVFGVPGGVAGVPGGVGGVGGVYMPHGPAPPHSIPQSLPQNLPPNLSQTIPQSLPHPIPQMTSSVPQIAPTVPQMAPNMSQIPQMSQMAPNVPQMAPNVPQMAPNVPQLAPNGLLTQPGQNNMMFMTQSGMTGNTTLPNPFFHNGLSQQNSATIQLSAANPFAQMQNQMSNLNLGGQSRGPLPTHGPPQTFMPPPQAMVGSLGMGGMASGMGMTDGMGSTAGFGATTGNPTLATKLWQ